MDRKRFLHVLCMVALAMAVMLPLAARVEAAEVAAPTDPVPGGPGFISISPLAFQPFLSSTAYQNYYYLVNMGATSASFGAPVYLPNGCTVKKMVVYYSDNEASLDMDVYLVGIEMVSGTFYHMASVTSSGTTPGYGYMEDTSVTNAVVDNQSRVYSLEVLMPGTTALSVLAVRIDYEFSSSLALLKR